MFYFASNNYIPASNYIIHNMLKSYVINFVVRFVLDTDLAGQPEEPPQLGLDAEHSRPHSSTDDETTSSSTPAKNDFLQLQKRLYQHL